jgi:hypothetical protein
MREGRGKRKREKIRESNFFDRIKKTEVKKGRKLGINEGKRQGSEWEWRRVLMA